MISPLSTRRLLRAAAWLIPLGVIVQVGGALLTSDEQTLRDIRGISTLTLLLTAGLGLLPWVMQTLRIRIWTRFVGHPISFLSGLRIVTGATLGTAVTPTAAGGGTIRWALATRWGLPAGKAASLLAVETLEDVVFFVAVVPTVMLLSAAHEASAVQAAASAHGLRLDPTAALVGVAVVAGLALLARLAMRGGFGARVRWRALRGFAHLWTRVRGVVRDGREVLRDVALRGKAWFALSLALTSLQWAARYSVATVVVVLLGGAFRPVLFWLLSWLTYGVSAGAPTPGAAGAAEATFLMFHASVIAPERLVAVTAAWRLIMFYLPALVAVVAFPLLGHLERRADEPREETAPGGPRPEDAPVPSGPYPMTTPHG